MKHVRLPRRGGKTTILLDAVNAFLEDSEPQCSAFIIVPDFNQAEFLLKRVRIRFESKPWKLRRVKVYTANEFETRSRGLNGAIFVDNIDMIPRADALSFIGLPVPVILATETGPERFWADNEDVPVNYDLVCIWCGEELESAEALELHEANHD